MSSFKFIGIIMSLGIFITFIIILIDMKRFNKQIEKAYNNNTLDIKKLKREHYKLAIVIMIISLAYGGLLVSYLSIKDGDLFEFAYNFNYATSNYYKDVDRKHLLEKAFDTVLKEFNDEYSCILDEEHKKLLEDGSSLNAGYNLTYDANGNLIVGDIYADKIKELGLNENDEIISVNGQDTERI